MEVNGLKYNPLLLLWASVLLLLCIPKTAYSQSLFQGQVTDSKNEPMVSVTVMLRGDTTATAPLKGYALTDQSGHFSFSATTTKGDWLIVKSLGYADVRLHVDSVRGNYAIVMREDAHTLHDVMVKGHYSGMKIVGDTIKFDTNHFRIGTEDNVGDVLRRLPGVTVSEEGKVSYQGKGMDKLLIDGKDLVSSGDDGVLVNNMNADLMTGAEILTDYKDKSIASQYNNRKLTALNIKTNGNWSVTGNANLQGGIKDKYLGKATLIHVGKKLSLTGMLSGNNVGNSILTFDDLVRDVRGIEFGLGNNSYQVSISPEESEMLYPSSDVFKKQAGLVSLSANYKPSDKFHIKGNVMFNRLGHRTQRDVSETYLTDSTTMHSLAVSDSRHQFARVSLSEYWQPSDRFELNGATQVDYLEAHKQYLDEGNGTLPLHAQQGVLSKNWRFMQSLAATYKLGKGVLYGNLDFTYANQRKRDSLQTDSLYLPISVPQQDDAAYLYVVSSNKKYLQSRISPEVGYTLKFAQLYNADFSVSYSYNRQQTSYLLAAQSYDQTHLTAHNLSAHASLSKSKGAFQYTLGAALAALQYRSNDPRLTQHKWAFLPKLSLSYRFSSTVSWYANADYSIEDNSVDQLFSLPTILRYNRMLSGTTVSKPYYRKWNVSSSFHVTSLAAQSFFDVTMGYILNLDMVRPYIHQKGLTSVSSYCNDGRMAMYYDNISWRKGLMFIPVAAKWTLGYTYNQNRSRLNDADNLLKTHSLRSSLGFTSTFKSIFNGELNGGYRYSSTRYSLTHTRYNYDEWNLSGALHLADKSWRATLHADYRKGHTTSYDEESVNLGFNLEYRIQSWGIKLTGENLLHINHYQWVDTSNTPYYTSTWIYQKMPGYVILGVTYKF